MCSRSITALNLPLTSAAIDCRFALSTAPIDSKVLMADTLTVPFHAAEQEKTQWVPKKGYEAVKI